MVICATSIDPVQQQIFERGGGGGGGGGGGTYHSIHCMMVASNVSSQSPEYITTYPILSLQGRFWYKH